MAESIRVENEAEELVALQALETYRALQPLRAEWIGALLCLEYTDQAVNYWSSKAA